MNGQNQFGGSGSGQLQNNAQGEWAQAPNAWSQDQNGSNTETNSFQRAPGMGTPAASQTSQQSPFSTGMQPSYGSGGLGGPQGPGSSGGAGQPPFPPAGQVPAYGNGNGNGAAKRSGGAKVSVLAAAALVLLGGGIGGAIGGAMASNNDTNVVNSLNEPQTSDSRPSPDGSIESVAEKVLPSVVSVFVQSGNTGGQGSGSILSSDGLVLTNFHVVDGADKPGTTLAVRLNDGTAHEANYVAGDPSSDIAVIKIRDVNGLTPIQLGNSDDLKVGQSVVAVGSPLGLTSTVTSGIVSAKNRPVRAGGENGGAQTIIDAIQTDAAINPGNSGGPLVDLSGKLIGINSVISTTSEKSGSIGLGFAIPINQARRIADELIDKGTASRSVINAQIDPNAQVVGAKVAKVDKGGAADRAGIKEGDVIIKVGDRSISDGDGLIAAIRSHQVGETVKLTVTDDNGGNVHDVDVTIEAASS